MTFYVLWWPCVSHMTFYVSNDLLCPYYSSCWFHWGADDVYVKGVPRSGPSLPPSGGFNGGPGGGAGQTPGGGGAGLSGLPHHEERATATHADHNGRTTTGWHQNPYDHRYVVTSLKCEHLKLGHILGDESAILLCAPPPSFWIGPPVSHAGYEGILFLKTDWEFSGVSGLLLSVFPRP